MVAALQMELTAMGVAVATVVFAAERVDSGRLPTLKQRADEMPSAVTSIASWTPIGASWAFLPMVI